MFPWSNANEVLFYMFGIICIKLIFVYLYLSPNTFPKILQKPGGQLKIRLSVHMYQIYGIYIYKLRESVTTLNETLFALKMT